jgi:hypothetical protein
LEKEKLGSKEKGEQGNGDRNPGLGNWGLHRRGQMVGQHPALECTRAQTQVFLLFAGDKSQSMPMVARSKCKDINRLI